MLQLEGTRKYTLLEAIPYTTLDGDRINVPIGFVTDLASVPRIFWNLFPPSGKYNLAAIVHDFLCISKPFKQKKIDRIFIEAMEELGVSWWKRHILHKAVRLLSIIKRK